MNLPLTWLSDAELQARIDRVGQALLEAQQHSERDRQAQIERDRCWIERRAALKERSRRQREGPH